MGVNRGTFETLNPSQFITFTFPNPLSSSSTKHSPNSSYNHLLRIAVLDSPLQQISDDQHSLVAAMLVPKDRQDDWIFSTETGHLQLLLNSPGVSRLILIGNVPREEEEDTSSPGIYERPLVDDLKYRMDLEVGLTPLLKALSPKSYIVDDVFEIPFLTYEDNLIRAKLVEKCVGSCVGEMLIEDVEVENVDELGLSSGRGFRRRLRFKRMPNLVQTEICIVSSNVNAGLGFGEVEFYPQTSCLVHPYLPPMVASLSLVAEALEECARPGNLKPRVLCLGIGGGALPTFLRTQFGFEVIGVENDEMVVKVGKRYFGLVEDELLRIIVGDGIEVIRNFAQKGMLEIVGSNRTNGVKVDQSLKLTEDLDAPFDIIMVDLDSGDATSGLGAPPLEFVRNSTLLAAKMALQKLGILVINVVPLSRCFYDSLVSEFRSIFSELYEINVGNDENYVLIATVSPVTFVSNVVENSILKKTLATSGQYVDRMRKI